MNPPPSRGSSLGFGSSAPEPITIDLSPDECGIIAHSLEQSAKVYEGRYPGDPQAPNKLRALAARIREAAKGSA